MAKNIVEEVAEKCGTGELKAFTQGDNIFITDGNTTGLLRSPNRTTKPGGYDERFSGPYKGFLMVRCENCGEVKGFCARQETYSFKCESCGHETPLEGLKHMYMKCKCGKEYRYKTNLTDRIFTRNCLNCGSPVDMELNKRETAYITI